MLPDLVARFDRQRAEKTQFKGPISLLASQYPCETEGARRPIWHSGRLLCRHTCSSLRRGNSDDGMIIASASPRLRVLCQAAAAATAFRLRRLSSAGRTGRRRLHRAQLYEGVHPFRPDLDAKSHAHNDIKQLQCLAQARKRMWLEGLNFLRSRTGQRRALLRSSPI